MLLELGWIERTGSDKRPNPHYKDLRMRSEEELYKLRQSLLHARKYPESFIAMVFKSDDRVWVDRCASIIKEK